MLITPLTGVSTYFGTTDVLEDVHWQIPDGTRAALVGRNGAGKTTLFRLLTGELEPDRGKVWRAKGTVIAATEQEVEVTDARTLREEAARGLEHVERLHRDFEEVTRALAAVREEDPGTQELLDRCARLQERLETEEAYSFESRIQAVLDGLHFRESDLDRPLREFSGGQKSRAMLARVLLRDPDLLLLDEPTNHLDLNAIEWLESFLQSYAGAFIVISHDRMFVNRVAREVVELRRHRLHRFQGNYDAFLAERERRLEEENRRYELQRAEILRQEDFIRRNIAGQNTKQAQSRRNRLERLERLPAPEWPASSIRMRLPEPARSGRIVVEAQGLAKRYGSLDVFRDLSFLLQRGQKLGLIGPNGVGKTTLLRILVGEESQSEGELRVGPGVQIGYYEQEQKAVRGPQSVLDEIWKITPEVNENEVRTFLGGFLFRGDEVLKPLHFLSGGERSRVALARLVREGANLLVLDEPTNHLDIESREVFEAALAAYAGTVLVVSHDRYFLDRVVDHVLELRHDASRLWEGGYSRYAGQRSSRGAPDRSPEPSPADAAGAAANGVSARAAERNEEKEERRRSYEEQKQRKREEERLRRRVAEAERRIGELESARENLLLAMADPQVATDATKLGELSAELGRTEEETRRAIAEWEDLAGELEAAEGSD